MRSTESRINTATCWIRVLSSRLAHPKQRIFIIRVGMAVKLDLINSRIGVALGPRVYDSLEGEFIQHPPNPPKQVVKAAFKNRQKRLDYMRKPEKTPDRFYDTVVDREGNFVLLNKSMRYRPPNSIPRPSTAEADDAKKLEACPKINSEEYPSLIADCIKDRMYNVKEDTVKSRLESGKLPGGVWDATGRKWVPPSNKTGPGYYEVYEPGTSHKGKQKVDFGGKFNEQPSGREHEEEVQVEFLPWHERKRAQRREKEWERKHAQQNPFHVPCMEASKSLSTLEALDPVKKRIPEPVDMKIGKNRDRFDRVFYKQESYVKTSGMVLSGDYDKKFDKTIKFSFQPPPPKRSKKWRKRHNPNKSESADVDVDVGHLFSMTHASTTSPVRYSSAFRSNAKVGLEIPQPTSGTKIGPGSFPGAFPTSIEIHMPERNSYYMLRGRKEEIRTPLPDEEEKILPFSVRHTKGPTFEQQRVGGGNKWLQEKVERQVKQIYPTLAQEMYPPPAESTWSPPPAKLK